MTTWRAIEERSDETVALVLQERDDGVGWRIKVTAHGASEYQFFATEEEARDAWNDLVVAAGLGEETAQELEILPPESPEELWATYLLELRMVQRDREAILEILTKFETDPRVREWVEPLYELAANARSWAERSLKEGLTQFHAEALTARVAEAEVQSVKMQQLPTFGRFG